MVVRVFIYSDNVMICQYLSAFFLYLIGGNIPELAGTKLGIFEFFDKGSLYFAGFALLLGQELSEHIL